MNEFGRMISNFNRNLDQILHAMNQMQTMYKTYEQMAPIWKRMSDVMKPQVSTASRKRRYKVKGCSCRRRNARRSNRSNR